MPHQTLCLLILAALGVSYSVATAGHERVRLAVAGPSGINLLNTWVLAAAVALPLLAIVPFVALLHLAAWPAHRSAGTKLGPYRFSSGASVVAAAAASVAASGVPARWAAPVAVVIFCTVNPALVAGRVLADREYRQLRMFLVPADQLTEFGTAGLGTALGACMLWSPVTGVLGVPLVMVVHRAALREAIHRTRSYDPSTGLHRERLWRAKAAEIVNRGKYAAVILIDPRGSAEQQIPHIIQGCLRPTDPIGRYDGGWFAAVTKTTAACGGDLIGDRIAAALDRAGVPCVVGVCCRRDWGLPEMLMSAAGSVMALQDDLDASAA